MNPINYKTNSVIYAVGKNNTFVSNILKQKIMNLKRFFGGLLTCLGIAGLIYAAVVFSSTSGETRDIKSLIIFGILGIVFFMSGISLVRTTKDES